MKKIKVFTKLIDKNKGFWKPFNFWGWFLRIFFFLVLLSTFILLFCIPLSHQEPTPQEPTPVPHTGQVQITLKWGDANDLDLSCKDPEGKIINYSNPISSSGGELDVDMNAGDCQSRTNPIENIYWPDGGAPKGKYTVFLTFYRKKCLASESSYTIDVKYGDRRESFSGTISEGDSKKQICTFTLE